MAKVRMVKCPAIGMLECGKDQNGNGYLLMNPDEEQKVDTVWAVPLTEELYDRLVRSKVTEGVLDLEVISRLVLIESEASEEESGEEP